MSQSRWQVTVAALVLGLLIGDNLGWSRLRAAGLRHRELRSFAIRTQPAPPVPSAPSALLASRLPSAQSTPLPSATSLPARSPLSATLPLSATSLPLALSPPSAPPSLLVPEPPPLLAAPPVTLGRTANPRATFSFSNAYSNLSGTLHVPATPQVARYVQIYTAQEGGRRTFSAWLRQGEPYFALIRTALAKYGLPEELVAVAFVESGFQPSAKSHAGAVGMWQFMQATARIYGLTVTSDLDERRDVELATDAAARHLRDLYQLFQNWELALAAYNAGSLRVQQLIGESGSSDFWTIAEFNPSIPEETANYVPKVLAVVSVLRNLEAHGFAEGTTQVAVSPAPETAITEVAPGTSLAKLAEAIGIELSELKRLNPHLLGSKVPLNGTAGKLTIPKDRLALAQLLLPDGNQPPSSVQELLLSQAVASNLAQESALANATEVCTTEQCRESEAETWDRLERALLGGSGKTYRVKPGDTLANVSRVLNVDTDLLQKSNGIPDPRRLRVGQLLAVPAESEALPPTL
jgi:soluble lytic murein transglycosylase-like protein